MTATRAFELSISSRSLKTRLDNSVRIPTRNSLHQFRHRRGQSFASAALAAGSYAALFKVYAADPVIGMLVGYRAVCAFFNFSQLLEKPNERARARRRVSLSPFV